MKNYVAYYRVSTKKQKKSGLGLESQKAITQHFSEIDKATIVKEFTKTESGKAIDNRPKLQQIIRSIDEVKFNANKNISFYGFLFTMTHFSCFYAH